MSKDAQVRHRAKHWVFTVNNYADEDCSQFEDLNELTTYWVYGKETSLSGTKHLQCYIAFKRTMELSALKRYWPRGHFEVMATKKPIHAADYCKKGDQPHGEWLKSRTKGPNYGVNAVFCEHGEIPLPQGAKGNMKNKKIWEEAHKDAQSGDFQKIPAHLLIPHYSNFKKIYFDYQPRPKDLESPCGEWIWGPPGVGKSYIARLENPSYYDKMLNKWWDQYDNEECILLDDFEIDHKVFGHHLKRWADQYAFTAEVKNHITNIRPLKIVVTSNYHPKQIWEGDMLQAILRRFNIREIQELEDFDRRNLKTGKKVKKRVCVSPITPFVAKKFKIDKDGILKPAPQEDPQKKLNMTQIIPKEEEENMNSITSCSTTETYSTSTEEISEQSL